MFSTGFSNLDAQIGNQIGFYCPKPLKIVSFGEMKPDLAFVFDVPQGVFQIIVVDMWNLHIYS